MTGQNYGGTGLSLTEIEALPEYEADAQLALAIASRRTMLDVVRQELAEAESLLRERLLSRDATLADCGAYEAKLEYSRSYEYDLEALAGLQRWLDVESYERAVQRIVPPQPEPYIKVDKRELNKLSKLGGKVAETIAAATREVGGPPRLVLIAKAGGAS